MLNRKVSITIPGTDHGVVRSRDDLDDWVSVEDALRVFSQWFGGATAIAAKGGWVDGQGDLVQEPVVLVYSFCDDASLAFHRDDVEAYAKHLAHDLGQECVAVEWPEGMEFYSEEKVAA